MAPFFIFYNRYLQTVDIGQIDIVALTPIAKSLSQAQTTKNDSQIFVQQVVT